jgi:hypothetical protein
MKVLGPVLPGVGNKITYRRQLAVKSRLHRYWTTLRQLQRAEDLTVEEPLRWALNIIAQRHREATCPPCRDVRPRSDGPVKPQNKPNGGENWPPSQSRFFTHWPHSMAPASWLHAGHIHRMGRGSMIPADGLRPGGTLPGPFVGDLPYGLGRHYVLGPP